MTGDMMGGLVGQNKRQLIDILRIGNQRQRERNNRTALFVDGLKGVGRHIGAIIDDNAEIAIQARRLATANLFGNRFDSFHDLHKIARRDAAITGLGDGGRRRFWCDSGRIVNRDNFAGRKAQRKQRGHHHITTVSHDDPNLRLCIEFSSFSPARQTRSRSCDRQACIRP